MPVLVEDARLRGQPTAAAPTWVICISAIVVLLFTVVLMVSLKAWQTAAPLLHPIAAANVISAAAALVIATIRPAPLTLCILLVVAFSGPWTFAVIRKVALDGHSGAM